MFIQLVLGCLNFSDRLFIALAANLNFLSDKQADENFNGIADKSVPLQDLYEFVRLIFRYFFQAEMTHNSW